MKKPTNPVRDTASQRHARDVEALRKAMLDSSGSSSPAERATAFAGGAPEPALQTFARKVIIQSFRISDADIQALLNTGCSQDAVFEITLSAALGAAMRRLDAGLRALKEAG